MKQSIKTSGILLVLLSLCLSPYALAAPRADQVVQLAVDAGDWLAAQSQAQSSGIAWPADAYGERHRDSSTRRIPDVLIDCFIDCSQLGRSDSVSDRDGR
ncbi:MAG: hypothetical protein QNJ07_04435, partial [Woeseiaceae bacterium]|nr:hypothetical protein [Woeseiaceae bacterium]